MTELLELPSSHASGALAPPVSVVILTKDEELNIADCLRSCAWCDDVHVLDSGSDDRTCEIAASMGATVHHHPFKSFGEQRNWAIDHIATKHEWVFHLDADEHFTPELVAEMEEVLGRNPVEAGYYIPHKLMFMGRWIRYAEGGYPIYQMRLFHKQRMRFRDYGHGQREDTTGVVGILAKPYLHYNFSKGISEWIDKHNRYSTLEAQEAFQHQDEEQSQPYSPFGNSVQRRRFIKAKIYSKLRGIWIGRFIWMYFLRLGFLDGIAGLHYCLLISTYDLFTTLKLAELKRLEKGRVERVPAEKLLTPTPKPLAGFKAARAADKRSTAAKPIVIAPERSPWTLREKIGRVLWMAVQALLFRPSFHNWYWWRSLLLKLFGAKLGKRVRVRPTVRIEVPWNLNIGDDTTVGDDAILYSLGPIRIGQRSTISQYAHLCAGTHNYSDPRFPLLRPPISIGDDAWVAADAFVGPGVTVGDRAIVGARATVVKDVEPGRIVAGNPAKVVKMRDAPQSARSAIEPPVL